MSKEELDKLSGKVDALTETLNGLGKTITDGVSTAFTNALKPLVDAQAAVLANEKAKEEAEKAGLIDKIVKANVLTEEVAKETSLVTLKALAANIKAPENAAGVRRGNFKVEGGNVVSAFKPPVAKKEA